MSLHSAVSNNTDKFISIFSGFFLIKFFSVACIVEAFNAKFSVHIRNRQSYKINNSPPFRQLNFLGFINNINKHKCHEMFNEVNISVRFFFLNCQHTNAHVTAYYYKTLPCYWNVYSFQTLTVCIHMSSWIKWEYSIRSLYDSTIKWQCVVNCIRK